VDFAEAGPEFADPSRSSLLPVCWKPPLYRDVREVNRERVVSLRVARCAAMCTKINGEPAKSAAPINVTDIENRIARLGYF
jgi:hypothetical protein